MKATTKKQKKGKSVKTATPKFRTIEDVQVGDFLVDSNGNYKIRILARLNDVIFVSDSTTISDSNSPIFQRYSSTNTIDSYKQADWTLESKDTKEVTMADVCKKFGYNVKIKK